MSRLERVIGASPSIEEMARILEGLGLPVRRVGEDLEVDVPTFRRDITIEADLIEEVVRVWGYDKIPSTLPGGTVSPARQPATLRQAEVVRRALRAAGLNEVITYSFGDPADEAALGQRAEADRWIRLLNPVSQDASILKSSLLAGLLRVVAVNVRRQRPNVRIFEVGKHYARVGDQPAESRWLGIAQSGARADLAWYATREPVDVYDVKGLAEHALAVLGVREPAAEPGREGHPYFERDRWGRLGAGGTEVGTFGEIALAVREAFGIPSPVFAATIPLDVIAQLGVGRPQFIPLPKHPSVQRDVAFVIPPGVSAADVERVIRAEGGPLLRGVTLFDLYAGEGVAPGTRSIAWRLTFRADDRTLTDVEVNDMHNHVIEAARHRLGVEVRGT